MHLRELKNHLPPNPLADINLEELYQVLQNYILSKSKIKPFAESFRKLEQQGSEQFETKTKGNEKSLISTFALLKTFNELTRHASELDKTKAYKTIQPLLMKLGIKLWPHLKKYVNFISNLELADLFALYQHPYAAKELMEGLMVFYKSPNILSEAKAADLKTLLHQNPHHAKHIVEATLLLRSKRCNVPMELILPVIDKSPGDMRYIAYHLFHGVNVSEFFDNDTNMTLFFTALATHEDPKTLINNFYSTINRLYPSPLIRLDEYPELIQEMCRDPEETPLAIDNVFKVLKENSLRHDEGIAFLLFKNIKNIHQLAKVLCLLNENAISVDKDLCVFLGTNVKLISPEVITKLTNLANAHQLNMTTLQQYILAEKTSSPYTFFNPRVARVEDNEMKPAMHLFLPPR